MESALARFSDEDFRAAILRALRLLVVLAALGFGLAWWKLGWPSAVLLLVGAAISGSGLWEWLRLLSALMAKMDMTAPSEAKDGVTNTATPRPMGRVLTGFFLRLVVAVAVLYVSLKFLDGSVYALAAGLALGIFALTVEALRLVRTWTV